MRGRGQAVAKDDVSLIGGRTEPTLGRRRHTSFPPDCVSGGRAFGVADS